MPSEKTQPLKALWGFFASVKLAIALLIILALAAALGTLLPQGQEPGFYLSRYGRSWGLLILAARLDIVYQSFWFLCLLFGLAANLIVCSLDRLPKTWSKMAQPKDLRLPNLKARQEFYSSLPAGQVEELSRQFLSRLGRLAESLQGEERIIFVQTGRLSRLGPYLIHLSILFFFAAGLATGLFGFKGYLEIAEGQSASQVFLSRGRVLPLDFQVRLDKFTLETYPGGRPKTYQSDLSFLKDGQVISQARVLVNQPVSFGGLTFYQASYGKDLGEWLELAIDFKAGRQEIVRLSREGQAEIPGLGRLKLLDFRSDLRGFGPAARLSLVREGGGSPETFWVISKPPYQMRPEGAEVIQLKDFDGRYYTGLQANRDPGVGFVWAGGLLMLFGLAVTFFFSHRRFWLAISPAGKGSRLRLVGLASRNQPAFERRFEDLAQRLAESLR